MAGARLITTTSSSSGSRAAAGRKKRRRRRAQQLWRQTSAAGSLSAELLCGSCWASAAVCAGSFLLRHYSFQRLLADVPLFLFASLLLLPTSPSPAPSSPPLLQLVQAKDVVTGKAHDAQEAVADTAQAVKDKTASAAETAKEKAVDAKDTVAGKASEAKDAVKGKAADARDFVADKAAQAREGAKDAAETARDKARGATSAPARLWAERDLFCVLRPAAVRPRCCLLLCPLTPGSSLKALQQVILRCCEIASWLPSSLCCPPAPRRRVPPPTPSPARPLTPRRLQGAPSATPGWRWRRRSPLRGVGGTRSDGSRRR